MTYTSKIISVGIACYLLFQLPLTAQQKYEREYRLHAEEVPPLAQDFLEACGFSSKIKWYGEESLDGHSVEAKLKEDGVTYSIEFDTLGHLQDVEIDIKQEQLPAATEQAIHVHLDRVFDKYRFIKIQKQWTGKNETILELIREGESQKAFDVKYEIVLKGKKDKERAWYEFLFSGDGSFEKRSTIIFRNTDNLDY